MEIMTVNITSYYRWTGKFHAHFPRSIQILSIIKKEIIYIFLKGILLPLPIK